MAKGDKINWLKLVGIAMLVHVILIALSVLTVFVYSYAIHTGESEEFYESFAQKASPYVSLIAGPILIYFFVTRLSKGKPFSPFIIGAGLPIIYIVIDFLIVILMIPDWMDGLKVLVISSLVKLLAGLIAAYRLNNIYAKQGGNG